MGQEKPAPELGRWTVLCVVSMDFIELKSPLQGFWRHSRTVGMVGKLESRTK